MLTDTQKRIINRILEDYSELQSIQLSLTDRTVEIQVSVMPDEATDFCRELGEVAGPETPDTSYKIRLSGLGKIAVSKQKEVLPKEIVSAKEPSKEFIIFMTSLFERQNIYEWNCFRDPLNRFKDAWEANWILEIQPVNETNPDFISFFKERAGAVWVIGFWFSDLQIEGYFDEDSDLGFIPVEKLALKYPKRVGKQP